MLMRRIFFVLFPCVFQPQFRMHLLGQQLQCLLHDHFLLLFFQLLFITLHFVHYVLKRVLVEIFFILRQRFLVEFHLLGTGYRKVPVILGF